MIILILNIIILLLITPILCYILILIFSAPRNKIQGNFGYQSPKSISVILPCFNEAQTIKSKILQIIDECQHFENYEIIIVDDGSNDSTLEIVNNFKSLKEIKIIKLDTREGKANALNIAVSASIHKILILTDARQTIKKGAFKKMCMHFSDPEIGAVSARLENQDKESSLRKFINFIKTHESRSGSTIGVYGALYAMRKSNYQKIPVETILDDLLIPINVLRQKKRVIFEQNAIIYDSPLETFYTQKRAVRIVSGLIQLLHYHSEKIAYLPLRYTLYLYSQKYFKLLIPILAIFLFVDIQLLYGINSASMILLLVIILVIAIIGRKEFFLLFKIFHNIVYNIRETTSYKYKWDKRDILKANTKKT